MALTDGNGGGIPATMLVGPASTGNFGGYPYPVYMNGGMGGGQGGFGGDNGWWIILLIILLAAGGWGNNNGNGGGFGGNNGLSTDFPWLLNGQQSISNNVSDGFRDAQLHDSVTSVRDGISALSTQLCNCCGDMQMSMANGFSGVNATINGAQNAISQQLYTNTIADLERSYAAQTASTQGMTNLQSQLAQCCCDNRLATEGLKYTIATENCQDRYEAQNNTRDIIQSQTAGFQRILDQMCADKIDAKNEKIADLERQLTMANLNASQVAQTARLERSNSDTVDALYNRLATCPVGTMPVYGNQPIFTCPQNNNGCGCGCNNGF